MKLTPGSKINICIHYYASLREKRKRSSEKLLTTSRTPKELYQELQAKHHFSLNQKILKVAVNDAFADWNTSLKNNDTVVFIPPVAGG